MTSLSRRCLACVVPVGVATPLVTSGLAAQADAAGTKVIATSEVPVGGGVVVTKKGVVVTQPRAGRFRVFSATCTHQGCQVSSVADRKIGCPCHGSEFAIGSGKAVTGPAAQPLPKREFVIKDGVIHLA